MKDSIWSFLAGPLGSAVRVAVALVLGSYVASVGSGGGLVPDAMTVQSWIGAALVVALPIVIAALNPNDPRYGRGSTSTD